VTILGGEPFDQSESLEVLVEKLKANDHHLVIYSGYTLESLLAQECESINRILANIDLLIDGAFKRELLAGAGEDRGSSNQRLILHPISRQKNERRTTKCENCKLQRRAQKIRGGIYRIYGNLS
jgi:anaerobic ribonucleoside-triphosphate reductase activating protein